MPILLLLLGVATLAVAMSNTGYKKPPPQTFTLDSNMPPDLRNQVLAALVSENDPAKLDAFAAAIAALYPLSASQLHAKAATLGGGRGVPLPIPPLPLPSPATTFSPLEIGQLPEPTRSQVLQQLASGNDPAAIEAFASQLEARSPAAAAALRLRASMLRSIPTMPAPTPQQSAPQAPDAPPFDPPVAPPPITPPAAPGLGLDPGMPPSVAQAVMNALTRETDPAKLRGFASSIPNFPIAAGLLMAKANALALVIPPAPPVPSAPTPTIQVATTSGTYVVQSGDFPIKIAQKLVHDGTRWMELVEANPNKKRAADGNFATLLPGEVLQLPASWGVPPTFEAVNLPTIISPPRALPPAAVGTYVVLPGEFPIKIAQKLVHDGKRWPELVAANPGKKRAADGNFANLQPGERLLLPASWTASAAPAAQTALLLSPGGSHASST